MRDHICTFCGAAWETADHVLRTTCDDCQSKHAAESRIAIAQVYKAVQRGDMPKAAELACVDCPAPASVYDHRDYLQPLKVEPVCRPCNMKRGPALNSFWRGQQMAQPV
jgi:hypothetical protein